MITTNNYSIIDTYTINMNVQHHNDMNLTDEGQKEVYIYAADIMKKNNYKTIADIGCGSGYKLIKYLSEYNTTGIETEPCFSYLKKKYPDNNWLLSGNPENSFLEYDISYDMVICCDVIEHINDPDILVNYLLSLNAKHYIISTPCRYILCNSDKYKKLYGYTWNGPPLNNCHVREWTMDEFKAYIGSKFDIIESYYGAFQIECQYHLLKKKK